MDYNNFNEYEEVEDKAKINKVKVISNALSISIAIIFSGMVLMSLYMVMRPNLKDAYDTNVLTEEQISRLDEAAKKIADNYLYDYDQDKIVDGAIEGMAAALENPFTYYANEEEYQEDLNSGSNGTYVGIGVHLSYDKETKAIKVLGVMANSPAEEAGICAGDVIMQVDDLYVTIDTYTDAVDAIKGEENTTVHLIVYRNNELKEFDIPRKKITENNVSSEILDGNIGYIKVFAFDNGVFEQFRDEYLKLKAQNVKGLIIDFRNNPGGYVSDALNMLNLLVPKTKILRLVDKKGAEKAFETDSRNQIDIPLAVIVNQNSASASEIFASAIKDTKKGVVIGTTTFGKGVVQSVLPITGHGALYIVSAQYFTPSNVVIQDNGIEPDIVVELPDEIKNNQFIDRDQDLQLQKAIEYINQ